MTLSQWITANWVTPYIQKVEARGRAEGVSEGLSQGISQGVAKSNAEWHAGWSARMRPRPRGWLLTNRRRMAGNNGRPPANRATGCWP